jgi:hypothetical protein
MTVPALDRRADDSKRPGLRTRLGFACAGRHVDRRVVLEVPLLFEVPREVARDPQPVVRGARDRLDRVVVKQAQLHLASLTILEDEEDEEEQVAVSAPAAPGAT